MEIESVGKSSLIMFVFSNMMMISILGGFGAFEVELNR